MVRLRLGPAFLCREVDAEDRSARAAGEFGLGYRDLADGDHFTATGDASAVGPYAAAAPGAR